MSDIRELRLSQKEFPDTSIVLETRQGKAYHLKTDIYKKIMWYSFDQNNVVNLTAVPVERVWQIINQNKNGEIVEELVNKDFHFFNSNGIKYIDILSYENLNKFDNKNKNKQHKKKLKYPQNQNYK